MAAIVSTDDIIEIEESDEINAKELAYDEFESSEIELEDVDWDDIKDFDESLLDNVKIVFVDDNNVVENIPRPCNPPTQKTKQQQTFQCENCHKKYKRKFYLEKHQAKCGVIESPAEMDASDNQASNKSEKKGAFSIPEDEIKLKAVQIVTDALNTVINNPIYSIKIGSIVSFGNMVKQTAENIHACSEMSVFKDSATSLVIDIYNILCKAPNLLTEQNLQTIMSNLHRLTLNQHAKDKWFNCVGDEVKTSHFSSLFQNLCSIITQNLMSMENQRHSTKEKPQDYQLSQQEQEVVRYVAGYIVYSLRRKYFKLSKSNVQTTRVAAVAVLQFLKNLQTKTESKSEATTFLEYTKKWIEIRNRGGLITVNDNMFLFVRIIENTVRSVLTLNFLKYYRGEDLRDIIAEKIKDNQLVTKYWEKLCRNMDNEKLKELLKRQVINKWIDIRARAYVNAYVQMVKRVSNKQAEKSKLSKAAEPALRKTIN